LVNVPLVNVILNIDIVEVVMINVSLLKEVNLNLDNAPLSRLILRTTKNKNNNNKNNKYSQGKKYFKS
jgi:hypothetical protein